MIVERNLGACSDCAYLDKVTNSLEGAAQALPLLDLRSYETACFDCCSIWNTIGIVCECLLWGHVAINFHERLVAQLHEGLLIFTPGFSDLHPQFKKHFHPKNLFHV